MTENDNWFFRCLVILTKKRKNKLSFSGKMRIFYTENKQTGQLIFFVFGHFDQNTKNEKWTQHLYKLFEKKNTWWVCCCSCAELSRGCFGQKFDHEFHSHRCGRYWAIKVDSCWRKNGAAICSCCCGTNPSTPIDFGLWMYPEKETGKKMNICIRYAVILCSTHYSVDSIKRTVHLAFHGLFSKLRILFTLSKQYF